MAVYAVIDDGHAVTGFPHMEEAMGYELKTSAVPRRVLVGGPVHVAELDLRGGAVGMYVDGNGHFQEALALVPVDLGLDDEGPAVGGQAEGLHGPGPTEDVLYLDDGFFGALGDSRYGLGRNEVCPGVAVKRVDVPGRPLVGEVGMELEDVPRGAGGDDLAPGHQVHQGHDVAVSVDLGP